jgi:3alpha(or 20beta)-hydroxysteroid dehydrogenase
MTKAKRWRPAGKIAFIAGGASGQGAAEARLFAAEGASVIVADIDHDAGREVAASVGGVYLPLDVSDY